MKKIITITLLSILLASYIKTNNQNNRNISHQSPVNIEIKHSNEIKKSTATIFPPNFEYFNFNNTKNNNKNINNKSSLKLFHLGTIKNQKIFISENNKNYNLHIETIIDRKCKFQNIDKVFEMYTEDNQKFISYNDICRQSIVLQLDNKKPFLFQTKDKKINQEAQFQTNLNSKIKIIPTDNTKIYANLDNKIYKLHDIHFQTSSEHTIDNKYYPLELHAVFENEEKEKAVIAVLYYEENDSYKNDYFNKNMQNILKNNSEDNILDINNFLPKKKNFYNYTGSLTTEPYTENVKWFIFQEIQPISKSNLDKIRIILKQNNRKIQPLNNRKIYQFIGN